MQTFYILDDGGLMTGIELQRHKKTIGYYNHLVDQFAAVQKCTKRYFDLRKQLLRSLDYYTADLIKAQKTAKLYKIN